VESDSRLETGLQRRTRGNSNLLGSDDRLGLVGTVTETWGTRIATSFFGLPRGMGWIPGRVPEQSFVAIIRFQTACLVRRFCEVPVAGVPFQFH
jgi:hypothetical protein